MPGRAYSSLSPTDGGSARGPNYGSGVTVTTLCPGYTHTEFHERARINRSGYRVRMMSAEKVALDGYRGLTAGKAIVIPGFMNKLMAAISRRLPAQMSARIVRRINGE